MESPIISLINLLFENIDNYVLPARNNANSNQLKKEIKWVMKHEVEIKNKLSQRLLEMRELENEYYKLF